MLFFRRLSTLLIGLPLAAVSTAALWAAPRAVPSAPEIRQATQEVLAQAKYRHPGPNPVQAWLKERLEQLVKALASWLESLAESPLVGEWAQLIFWAVLAVALLLVVFLVVRALLRRQRGPRGLPTGRQAAAPEAPPSPLSLQAQARRLARDGQFGAALRLLHQACLLALDRRGLLVVRPSTTNGEYLRQLAPHPELRQLLGEVARLVERHLYGGEVLNESQYRQGERWAQALLGGGSAG